METNLLNITNTKQFTTELGEDTSTFANLDPLADGIVDTFGSILNSLSPENKEVAEFVAPQEDNTAISLKNNTEEFEGSIHTPIFTEAFNEKTLEFEASQNNVEFENNYKENISTKANIYSDINNFNTVDNTTSSYIALAEVNIMDGHNTEEKSAKDEDTFLQDKLRIKKEKLIINTPLFLSSEFNTNKIIESEVVRNNQLSTNEVQIFKSVISDENDSTNLSDKNEVHSTTINISQKNENNNVQLVKIPLATSGVIDTPNNDVDTPQNLLNLASIQDFTNIKNTTPAISSKSQNIELKNNTNYTPQQIDLEVPKSQISNSLNQEFNKIKNSVESIEPSEVDLNSSDGNFTSKAVFNPEIDSTKIELKNISNFQSNIFKENKLNNTITEQVSFKVLKAIDNKSKVSSFELEPANLGKIEIQFEESAGKKQITNLKILTEKFTTFDSVSRSVTQIENILRDSGIKGEINIELGLKNSSNSHFSQNGKNFTDDSNNNNQNLHAISHSEETAEVQIPTYTGELNIYI